MKRSTIIAILTLCCASAFAGEAESQQPALGVNQGQSQSTLTESSSGANNTGVNQNITFTSPPETRSTVTYKGKQKVLNVPSVSGPQLVTGGNDMCSGSTSGSINVAGFGGGYGSTWNDEHCKMLKSTAMFANLGQVKTAMARMCEDDINRKVMKLTGYECPQEEAERQEADTNGVVHPELTDPISRVRMGYPPLK